MTLIHFLNPGKQLEELNAEWMIDSLRKANRELERENEELKALLDSKGSYKNLSSQAVNDSIIGGVARDLLGEER